MNGRVHGKGKFEYIDAKHKPTEKSYDNLSIDKFVKSYDHIIIEE